MRRIDRRPCHSNAVEPCRRPNTNARLPAAHPTNRDDEKIAMEDANTPTPPILRPSTASIGPDAQVFGVLTGSTERGFQVAYLTEVVPATDALFTAVAPAKPSEVFRAASRYMEHGCRHFDGADCQLVRPIVAMLDPVVGALPRCAVRPRCRWFRQEGRDACLRFPQVATEERNPSDLQYTPAG